MILPGMEGARANHAVGFLDCLDRKNLLAAGRHQRLRGLPLHSTDEFEAEHVLDSGSGTTADGG